MRLLGALASGVSLLLGVAGCSVCDCGGPPQFTMTVQNRCIVDFETTCPHTYECGGAQINASAGTCDVAVRFDDDTTMNFAVTFTFRNGGWDIQPPRLDLEFPPTDAGTSDASSE